ncbi:MAG: 50S ribosomal protein L17 [Deltaproteobacteria bacterium RIFCSPLOWO2_02_FULL_57_26]|uniref:Large ribosomal subunit protein bL17 n=1 Tax=uncultured delta proteobacterium Rifle_16ft_4_minimus_1997 TaxID=1665176 RepID=A0A0H4T1P5_9DELT|nr:50S ribosomal protein L17, large subunit ribosomal protein L17 [uncultured delta proteobacterium Rifle_16ft_4_minimus_1997]OGQ52311.1 MAG: 50S ribosomal protein L17 [Deltaproteobacteria bacterium RIFCSPLOWO2_02_FULL_57_26]OGQ76094.1 MAG: 50S ribosomal protein L17 [Deltaproteobacteria bacterium RIFCSPLOWO2_12_FULL_57_22]
MRHLKAGRKLNRSPSHRLALMRNLVTLLLRHERVKTTDPKAKELRRWVDRMIGLGKEGSLHARRRALGFIRDKAVVRKVFDTLAPRFKERNGGYTRIVKLGWRRGDHAALSMIQLVSGDGAEKTAASAGEKKKRRRSVSKQDAARAKGATDKA